MLRYGIFNGYASSDILTPLGILYQACSPQDGDILMNLASGIKDRKLNRRPETARYRRLSRDVRRGWQEVELCVFPLWSFTISF